MAIRKLKNPIRKSGGTILRYSVTHSDGRTVRVQTKAQAIRTLAAGRRLSKNVKRSG